MTLVNIKPNGTIETFEAKEDRARGADSVGRNSVRRFGTQHAIQIGKRHNNERKQSVNKTKDKN